MDIAAFPPLVSAVFVIALGLVVFLHGGKNRMNFTFVLFAATVTGWLLGTFMMFLDKTALDKVIFWDKFVYVGVVFIPSILYHFGLALINDVSKRRKIILWLGYALSTFFLLLIPTNLFVSSVFVYSWGAHTIAQPLHTVFLVYFAVYLFLWFRMVYAHYKQSTDLLELHKTRLVFIGFAALALGSIGFLPAYGISVYPFSYVSGVIFTAILAYTILKFQLFSIKIVIAELLVFMIWIAVFIQVLMADTLQGEILGGAVLASVFVLGAFLIQSVNREWEQLEKIEKLADELQNTNDRQETLIHFIGHEVKGALTKDEGAFAELVEGDFGTLPDTAKPFVERALAESRYGVEAVSNILKASNLKRGVVNYTNEPLDIKALAQEAVEHARPLAVQKGLALSFVAGAGSYQMTGDPDEIRDHVFRNLIENAINYTPSGSVTVSVSHEHGSGGDRVVFSVQDTGVGITDEDKQKLFTEGGHGKDSQKVNPNSTGYGLFISKMTVEAQGGEIRAVSDGAGKGATFIVEFQAA